MSVVALVSSISQGVAIGAQATEIDAQGASIDAQGATIDAQAATIGAQAATIGAQGATIDAQGATIGAQATEIEYASGNGAEPANEAVELFGCFPLYRGQAHARNHHGANGSILIPVGDRFWHRPVGAGFYKGCHDNLKIPLSGVAGGISHDTTADTQCPFDEMSTLAGVTTQTKALEQIYTIPQERQAVYEGSVDKGEWCEPGCLGYRVHCTADAIFLNKYSHPTIRTTEYLCESTCFRIGDGMIFQHVDEDKKNVLVAITKAPNLVNPQNTRYQGTLTPRFMNALNSVKSAEGRALTEAKLVASGKTSTEATAAFDEFVARLNHVSSDSEVESGAHNDNAGLWKSGIGYCDQVIVTLIYDDVNNEVQVFEQCNYSDGIFTDVPGGFAFTGAELSVPVQDVINVLLADTPLQYEYEGAAGKYQNRLRTKAFPANSKFGLKKVSRQAIAVAQNKTIAQVDEEQRLYSVNSNAELKSVLKWRQWKAAERYFMAHRDVATAGSNEKTYYDRKAEDYYNLALAMATHAATFDNVSALPEPTPVPWNAGDGGLLDVRIEDGKVVSGYSYHSSRDVAIANSAAERTFVPAYELNYSVANAQATADFTLNRANAELLGRLNAMLSLEQKQEILNKKHPIYRIGYQNRPQGINQEEIEAQALFMTSLKQKAKDDLGVDIDMYVNYQKDTDGNPILDQEVKVAFVFGFPDLATHNKVIALESNADQTDPSTFLHKVANNSGLSPTEIDLWMFITDDTATNTQTGLSEDWVYDSSAAAGSLKSIMSAGNVWDGMTGQISSSWWNLVVDGFNRGNTNNLHIGRFSELRAQIGSSVISESNGVYTLTPAKRLNIGVGFGPDSTEALAVNMIDVELAILSQGQMRARLYNAGATSTTELDAGTIDANLMFGAYALGFSAASQLPANGLATAYTGMTAAQTTSYYLSEQGKLDYEDIYEGSNYYGFPTCQVGPEAFGWSKTRVTNLAEMREQNAIRTPGGYLQTISQNVYRDGPDGPDNVLADDAPTTVGGVVAGTYDMWEWNSAGVDATLIETYGGPDATIKDGVTYPYHYPNGFHQVTALTDLVFTRTKLAEFEDDEIEWIREACARTAIRFQGARAAKVSRVLKNIRDSTNGWSGITILDTPTDIRDAFILEAKSVLDNLDWTSNPEDGVKFNQMLANLLAYANPGPSVEGLITFTQVNLNNAVSTQVRHSDLNYGRAEKRLALALDPLLADEEYILTAEGKRVWETDPRTVDVDGVETQIYIAAGSPAVGTVLKPDDFKNAAMQLPTSLMNLGFGPNRLIPNGFTEDSWPNLVGIAVREAATIPDQPVETTHSDVIKYSDLAVVGYTTVGADPYGVVTDYSIANPGVEGVSFRQPNTATVAVSGLGGLYYKKHVSNYEFKVKITYKGFHPNASVLGANLINTGIFVGNKKINFNDSSQISPWFFNGQTVAEHYGSWFDGTTYHNPVTGGIPLSSISHEDSSYLIIQCMGNDVRYWMSLNSTTLNLITWESGETLTLPKAESDTAGSFGIQMEGTDWDATNMSISPITAFSTDATRTF